MVVLEKIKVDGNGSVKKDIGNVDARHDNVMC